MEESGEERSSFLKVTMHKDAESGKKTCSLLEAMCNLSSGCIKIKMCCWIVENLSQNNIVYINISRWCSENNASRPTAYNTLAQLTKDNFIKKSKEVPNRYMVNPSVLCSVSDFLISKLQFKYNEGDF